MKSYLIIGGGIIGSAIARELCRRDCGAVTVIEKEAALGRHASSRNSSVLHSGINQKPGSLKARMCVEGSEKARQYCTKNGIPMNECGTLVIAQTEEQERVLRTLLRMGREAGVKGLRIIGRKEIEKREPAVVASKGLFSPTGAVVESHALVQAIAAEAQMLGAAYVFGAEVQDIKGNAVLTSRGEHSAEYIINCAGLYADVIARMMGVGKEYRIIPFRGEYLEIRNLPINSMVYQVPDLRYPFLGVHFTRRVDGRIIAGPTATLSLGRESYNKEINLRETAQMVGTGNFWRLILGREFRRLAYHNAALSLFPGAFHREIQKLCKPAIATHDLLPFRSGIRAQLVDRSGKMVEDMVVEFGKNSVHILNAVSPGLTCSFAFAEYLVDMIAKD